MISTNIRWLTIPFVLSLASFASSLHMGESQGLAGPKSSQHNTITAETNTSGAIGTVIFSRGRVVDQSGTAIEAGSVIGTHSVITVDSDGFLAIELLDGSTLNIQPDTSTSIASAMIQSSEEFIISAPYASGGIRG